VLNSHDTIFLTCQRIFDMSNRYVTKLVLFGVPRRTFIPRVTTPPQFFPDLSLSPPPLVRSSPPSLSLSLSPLSPLSLSLSHDRYASLFLRFLFYYIFFFFFFSVSRPNPMNFQFQSQACCFHAPI
jgi:hypothetical protein